MGDLLVNCQEGQPGAMPRKPRLRRRKAPISGAFLVGPWEPFGLGGAGDRLTRIKLEADAYLRRLLAGETGD